MNWRLVRLWRRTCHKGGLVWLTVVRPLVAVSLLPAIRLRCAVAVKESTVVYITKTIILIIEAYIRMPVNTFIFIAAKSLVVSSSHKSSTKFRVEVWTGCPVFTVSRFEKMTGNMFSMVFLFLVFCDWGCSLSLWGWFECGRFILRNILILVFFTTCFYCRQIMGIFFPDYMTLIKYIHTAFCTSKLRICFEIEKKYMDINTSTVYTVMSFTVTVAFDIETAVWGISAASLHDRSCQRPCGFTLVRVESPQMFLH